MTDPLPPERVEEIRARLEAATAGPWCWVQTGEKINAFVIGAAMDEEDRPLEGLVNFDDIVETVCEIGSMEGSVVNYGDAEFIANAPADIAALLAERSRLLREIEAARICEGDRRHSLAQEIAEGLKLRGHWIPTDVASSDLIGAVFLALKRARKEEREACAKLAETRSDLYQREADGALFEDDEHTAALVLDSLARLIRARGDA